MKSAIVLTLIVVFMFMGWVVNKWLQKIIRPRESFGKLLLFFLSILIMIFILCFLMVFVITKLYPDELIK